MNDQSRRCYDITITVTKDSSPHPGPAEFARAAEKAATARGATGTMSAHTAEKIISIVTVTAASRPAAMAVAMAVVSDALTNPPAPANQTTPPD